MTIDSLTSGVALRLGEYPCLKGGTSSLATDLASMVREAAPGEAVRLSLSLPVEVFRAPRDFRDYVRRHMEIADYPYGRLLLPADFLRLHSLRLEGWTAPCDDLVRRHLGASAPQWLAVRPSRPWLECIPAGSSLIPSDGSVPSEGDEAGNLSSRMILNLSPAVSKTPVTALYIPRPYLDTASDCIQDVDPGLIPHLIESLTSIFKNI